MYEKYNKLNDYNEEDLLCLLSCFYDLKVKDDFKTHIPSRLKNELTYIDESIQTYTHQELQHQLYITCQYHIQYDLMDYMKTWYKTVHNEDQSRFFFDTLKQEKDIFIGDFMKCCMKIVNMCNELKIFGENDENYAFVEKISIIQQNIQKNIVTNQSFYL